uniref:Amblyomma 40 33 family member n=1 Tax=Rhipicephalus zambeziensis TaxID=60191 RepID=A0A224Z1V2_9ACAR
MLRLLVICLAVVAASSQRSQTTTERYEDTLYKFLDLLEDDDPSRVPGAPVFTGPRSTYRPSVPRVPPPVPPRRILPIPSVPRVPPPVPPRRIFRPIRPIPSVSSPALPGGTIRDANAYMDTIMQQKMPRLLKASPRLYPSAVIPFFKFKVLKTGFTNRDLKVNMTAGVFRGFDTGIRRLGDCDKPSHVGRNTSVSCTLDFSGITASFVAVTKGDDLAGTIKAVPVNVVVRTGAVRIEATAAPGKEAILRTFLIDYVSLDVAHGANLSLNEDRDRGFKHHVRTNVARELDALMHEEYAPLLGRAIATTDLPKAA